MTGTYACRAALKQFEEVGKWLNECFAAKQKQFSWSGIHNLPESWSKRLEADS